MTKKGPRLALAVNVGAVASPLTSVVTCAVVVPPANAPEGPVTGATKATAKPDRGRPAPSDISTTNGAYAPFSATLCGLPDCSVIVTAGAAHCSNTATSLSAALVTSMSILPSRFRSTVAMAAGCAPTGYARAGWNVPSPLPTSRATVSSKRLAIARSFRPSPLKSAMTTLAGPLPVANCVAGPKVPSPWPRRIETSLP